MKPSEEIIEKLRYKVLTGVYTNGLYIVSGTMINGWLEGTMIGFEDEYRSTAYIIGERVRFPEYHTASSIAPQFWRRNET